MRAASTIVLGSMLALAAAPVAAADLHLKSLRLERRSGAFIGGTLRLNFDRRGTPLPIARLGVGFTHHRLDAAGGGASMSFQSGALELGLSRGAPELFVAGRSLSDIDREARRLGMRGSSGTALLVVGALAAGAVAVAAFTGDDEDGPPNPCPDGAEVCTQ